MVLCLGSVVYDATACSESFYLYSYVQLGEEFWGEIPNPNELSFLFSQVSRKARSFLLKVQIVKSIDLGYIRLPTHSKTIIYPQSWGVHMQKSRRWTRDFP